MRRFAFGLLVSLFFSSHVAFSISQRCGGDGPQPFIDLSGVAPKAQVIKTTGPVQEFLLWEGHNSVVYRTTRGEIFNRHLSNGWEDYLGVSQVALSPVLDRSERAVLLDRTPWFNYLGQWVNFYVPVARPRHLFWSNSSLFMLENEPGTSKYSQQLTIHHLRYGATSSNPVCRFLAPVGERYLEAAGATYPIVPFYTVRPTPAGFEVTVYQMDAGNCSMTNMGTYKDPFEGNVLSVHRFGAINGYAVHTDHLTKNLMWDYGGNCHFYDIGKHPPMVPNPSRPLIATWDSTDGLELMNLNTRNRATYFPAANFKAVRGRDVQISTYNDRLYFSPEVEEASGRVIFEVDVKEVAR